MSKFFGFALLAACNLSCAAQAAAAGITYDCDTASGHFSELVLPAPSGAFVVDGKVRLMQIAEIGKFAPLTRLAISGPSPAPGETPENLGGFVLTALPANAVKKGAGKGLMQFLRWDERNGGASKSHDPFALAGEAQEFDFRLSYDGSTVAVRVGGQEQRIALKVSNPVVRIICSTGEFLYTDVKISTVG
jgi:hypothetical protein